MLQALAVKENDMRQSAFDRHFARLSLADLPTPVVQRRLTLAGHGADTAIKCDDVSAKTYGGNKVRKLEFLLAEATEHNAQRVATFGTVGSHHALATAIYAHQVGLSCTCFLSHQSKYPGIGDALRVHQSIGTDIVKFGGRATDIDAIQREHLSNERSIVVPVGGSSALGTLGYVNAGLELATQIDNGETEKPARIYVALGTAGTVAGLALGLVLAGCDAEIHAVAVSVETFSGEHIVRQVLDATVALLREADAQIPRDLAGRVAIVRRDGFLGPGYGRIDATTERAIGTAREQLGLALDRTYTGKTFAALLSDLEAGYAGPVLFWNTCNSRPLNVDRQVAPDPTRIPDEFIRYFDDT